MLMIAGKTTGYWQGEVFAVVWVVCILPMLLHLLTHPALRRRAPRAEKDARQIMIKALFALCGVALIVVSLVTGELDY
jgi:formate-dependent nitrite reductase membrane component NrfD